MSTVFARVVYEAGDARVVARRIVERHQGRRLEIVTRPIELLTEMQIEDALGVPCWVGLSDSGKAEREAAVHLAGLAFPELLETESTEDEP